MTQRPSKLVFSLEFFFVSLSPFLCQRQGSSEAEVRSCELRVPFPSCVSLGLGSEQN